MKPEKQKFIAQIKDMRKSDKKSICRELIDRCDPKHTDLIPRWRREYGYLKGRFVSSGKLSDKQMFKLYLIAYYDNAELDHWQITSSQCFRTKKPQRVVCVTKSMKYHTHKY